jgi:COP9 signalosome complex subunit 6
MNHCSTPLLLLLQPVPNLSSGADGGGSALPFKAYEPTIELKDRVSRSVFVEATYNVETGEAERIAVDWTARGGGTGTSCEHFHSHTQDQETDQIQWNLIYKPSEQQLKCYTTES